MASRTFRPDEYFTALKDKQLGEIEPVSIVGFVKPDEGDPPAFLWAPYACERWIQIPMDVVATVEDLGTRPCGDHSHRWARLELRASDAVEAKILRILTDRPPGLWASEPEYGPGLTPRPEALYGVGTHSARRWQPNPLADCVRGCNGDPGCIAGCFRMHG